MDQGDIGWATIVSYTYVNQTEGNVIMEKKNSQISYKGCHLSHPVCNTKWIM